MASLSSKQFQHFVFLNACFSHIVLDRHFRHYGWTNPSTWMCVTVGMYIALLMLYILAGELCCLLTSLVKGFITLTSWYTKLWFAANSCRTPPNSIIVSHQLHTFWRIHQLSCSRLCSLKYYNCNKSSPVTCQSFSFSPQRFIKIPGNTFCFPFDTSTGTRHCNVKVSIFYYILFNVFTT